MIQIICPGELRSAGDLVEEAFVRSFSKSQVKKISFPMFQDRMHWKDDLNHVFVFLSPLEEWTDSIRQSLKNRCKIILFGALPPSLASDLEFQISSVSEDLHEMADCDPAPTYAFRTSPLKVRYRKHLGSTASPMIDRPFLRFDFTDEWNNLGFGAIRLDGSPWSLSQIVTMNDHGSDPLADVVLEGKTVSAYSVCRDFEKSSLLWFNRLVGPIDSQEWRLVEEFVSSYRYKETSCLPSLSEIPFGYEGATTMRLDCDEDIISSQSLFRHYQKSQIPFSLAVHTALLTDKTHLPFLKEVLSSGGTLLSHSASHPIDWGGGYQTAFSEAIQSRKDLFSTTGTWVRYAVSPFHQTPEYALRALSDAGYSGCIGGVINSNPEFLMARGGSVVGVGEGFVGHSQQCMLHGDCLLEGSDPLSVYKESFEIAFRGRALFGFLDHPFSNRYQYGWKDEDTRRNAHKGFLDYITGRGKVLFLSEGKALDFLREKGTIEVHHTKSGFCFDTLNPVSCASGLVIAAELGGQAFPIHDGVEIT